MENARINAQEAKDRLVREQTRMAHEAAARKIAAEEERRRIREDFRRRRQTPEEIAMFRAAQEAAQAAQQAAHTEWLRNNPNQGNSVISINNIRCKVWNKAPQLCRKVAGCAWNGRACIESDDE